MTSSASFWQDRPVLVTGATGLVGGWLTKFLLDKKADLVCLVRDQARNSAFYRDGSNRRCVVVRGDLHDQALLERVLGEYEIDTVFHLAAQTIVPIANRNPSSTFESNIAGTWRLLEAARRSPLVRQIVVASSDKAYGDCDQLPYDETTPLRGRHPYDVSKSCSDLIAQSYATTYGLPVIITRCGNFYGGGDVNWNRIVPGSIRSLLRGQAPIIRSDGQSIRDYFYVEDGAYAYMLLAEKLAENRKLIGEAFNFSNESRVTVLDLVQKISQLVRDDLQPIIRNESTNEIRHQCLSAAKARRMLDWAPRFDFDESLRRTVMWYQEFFAERSA